VPLPAPGAPNRISLMDVLGFYEFVLPSQGLRLGLLANARAGAACTPGS
jgi:hypothetical protein